MYSIQEDPAAGTPLSDDRERTPFFAGKVIAEIPELIWGTEPSALEDAYRERDAEQ